MRALHSSTLMLVAILTALPLESQEQCANSVRIEGLITDPTGAVVPGATIVAPDGKSVTADASGRYALPCEPAGTVVLKVRAQGFADKDLRIQTRRSQVTQANVKLLIATVQDTVQVSGDSEIPTGPAERTLGIADLPRLADDPNDLIQQLQLLASNGGGPAESTTIVVDGFQNPSALPSKNAIASVRINPDPYSPEYEGPTFRGGRVEITTKPGADDFHGALFFVDSDGSFNASDPFSLTATPASKRRYGFELNGPTIRKKSGFALALERRDISEFNVVNATVLGIDGNVAPLHQSVPANQQLWVGSGRVDWQLSSKDQLTASFSANANSLSNQGVGGLTLLDAGYGSTVGEYDLRLSNTRTMSENSLHETRLGYSWKRTAYAPNSAAPSIQVAGYFTGGGSVSQALNDRERDLEIDDDLLLTRGKHSLKIGAQSLGYFVHNFDPNIFNGAYVFGGGSAPALDGNGNPTGQTTTITPIQQYQRALRDVSGGSPTTYQLTTGTALVSFTQWRLALYLGDDIKLAPRLSVSTGLRYSFQTAPSTFANFAPRIAFTWSPDAKSSWVLHARAGIFNESAPLSYATDVYRLNGVRQQSAVIYSPNYNNPLTLGAGSIEVATRNQFAPNVQQFPAFVFQAAVEHELPHHWRPSVSFSYAQDAGIFRTRNINAPFVASETGSAPDPTAALRSPRPLAPNQNIFQYENTGHLNGSVLNLSLAQHSYKAFDINLSAYMLHFKSDASLLIDPPQSSYSNRGESSRPDWQSQGGSADGTLHLPAKIQLSAQLAARTGHPYNITTGTDANGDGTFNDRPSYTATPGAGAYSTPYGLLTANTVNGTVARNVGTMPSVWHLFANASRSFTLNPNDKDHPRTLTLNARAANLLNHTNTTGVQTVLAPNVGMPLSAEAARRLELGARFAF